MEFIAQVFQRDLEHTASVFIPSRRWKVIEAIIITATLTNWVLYNILCVIPQRPRSSRVSILATRSENQSNSSSESCPIDDALTVPLQSSELLTLCPLVDVECLSTLSGANEACPQNYICLSEREQRSNWTWRPQCFLLDCPAFFLH